MSDVEIGRWENKFLEVAIWWIKIRGEYWFFGREFALALKYTDPNDPIKDLIDTEDKKTIEELLGVNYKFVLERSLKSSVGKFPRLDFFQRIQKKQKLTNEFGLYSFCSKSRKPKAKPFQRWIYNTIITIRKTGFYALPDGPIDNPLDLIAKPPTLEKKIKTCDKGTQTLKNTKDIIEDSFRKLEVKMEKSIIKAKSELKESLGELTLFSSPHYSSSSSHFCYSSSDSD